MENLNFSIVKFVRFLACKVSLESRLGASCVPLNTCIRPSEERAPYLLTLTVDVTERINEVVFV